MFYKNNNRQFFNIIIDFFQVSLLLYLLLFVFDEFKMGFVSNFINLNWILGIVVISGVLILFFKNKFIQEKSLIINRKVDLFFISLISLVVIFFVYQEIRDLKWLALVISILSGILIWFISYFIIKDEEKK